MMRLLSLSLCLLLLTANGSGLYASTAQEVALVTVGGLISLSGMIMIVKESKTIVNRITTISGGTLLIAAGILCIMTAQATLDAINMGNLPKMVLYRS